MGTRLAVPQNNAELREMLTDRQTIRNLLSDADTLPEFIQSYANAQNKFTSEASAQVNEQCERFMVNFLKENQGATDSIMNRLNLANPSNGRPRRTNTLYNKAALGAKHDGMFNHTADFLHAISEHAFKDGSNGLGTKLESLKNDLSSVKPADGGYLIPEILRAELLSVALETAVVRSRARVIPMDSLTVGFPKVDSTSNVSSVYGGVTGYWTEEGATLTESQPRFSKVELRANKLCLYTEVPNELIRDARPAMEAFINEIFPEAMAWFEDVAFFVGGGVGEPLGFLNAPATVSVTRAGSDVDWVDLAGMYARMLPQSLGRAVWIVSPDIVDQLITMPFTSSGTVPILLGGGGFPSGNTAMPLSILGRPVIVSEKARAAGTEGDINFVDFGFYLIGDRQAMSARQSEDFRFSSDVTAFRVIERLDGRPWLDDAITPQNGSANTLSPFVNLA